MVNLYQRIKKLNAIMAAIAENPILAEPFSIRVITASFLDLISFELNPKLAHTRANKLAESSPGKLRNAFARLDGTPLARVLSQTALRLFKNFIHNTVEKSKSLSIYPVKIEINRSDFSWI